MGLPQQVAKEVCRKGTRLKLCGRLLIYSSGLRRSPKVAAGRMRGSDCEF